MANIKEQVLNAFISLNQHIQDPSITEIIERLQQADIQFPTGDLSKLTVDELEDIGGLIWVTLENHPSILQETDHNLELKQLLIKTLQLIEIKSQNKFRSTL